MSFYNEIIIAFIIVRYPWSCFKI